MGISVADNFDHKSKKPLDARTSYTTLALMKAVTDANMNEGCLAYCAETDKYYKFLSTNTVDSTTGKWREFSSGGGAGSDTTAYHTDDSAETGIADVDSFPFYDASASAPKKSLWSNIKSVLKTYFDTLYDLNKSDIPMYGTSSTGASTTAKTASVTRGTFTLIAGAKVSIKFTNTNTASAPTLNVGSTGAKNIKYIDSDGTVTTPTTWWGAGEVVTFVYDGTQWLMMPTISMMPSIPVVGTINRSDIYDTTEKVVGKWTDGRPVYQKSFNYTMPTVSTDGTRAVGSFVAIGASVGTVVDIQATLYSASASTYDVVNYVDKLSESTDPYRKYTRFFVVNNSASSNKNTLCALCDDISFSGATAYVTIRYTKTTDAANSYNYADENDYSTSEKIVGTWIDGKKIYQKTLSVTVPTTTDGVSATSTVSVGSTVSKFVDIRGIALFTSTSGTYVVTNDANPTNNRCLRIVGLSNSASSDKNSLQVYTTWANASGATLYITVKYTKTTD